jgi:hypothetical protein
VFSRSGFAAMLGDKPDRPHTGKRVTAVTALYEVPKKPANVVFGSGTEIPCAFGTSGSMRIAALETDSRPRYDRLMGCPMSDIRMASTGHAESDASWLDLHFGSPELSTRRLMTSSSHPGVF